MFSNEPWIEMTPGSGFPDLGTLTAVLRAVLQRSGHVRLDLMVLARKSSPRASTFPSEIVTCRTDKGKSLRLYCKYTSGYMHTRQDPRHGIAYEVEVYRNVLKPLQTTTPRFCGAHTDTMTGGTWLILEYLENSVPVSYTRRPAKFLDAAARWAGRFHAVNEARLKTHSLPFLVRCGTEYYIGCARRTLLFAEGMYRRYPWLRRLCRRYEELVDLLVHPLTVIHGEYEIDNLLTRNGKVYPVDWEAAAIAAGEIDLANLTSGWPAPMMRQCEREYQQARWPGGPPPEFAEKLGIARLHFLFRWLAGRRAWTKDKSFSNGWFKDLHSIGEQMGLI